MAKWNYEKSQWEIKVGDNWVKQQRVQASLTNERLSNRLKAMKKKLDNKDKNGEVVDRTGVSICAIGKRHNESVATIKRRINSMAKDMIRIKHRTQKPSDIVKQKQWEHWVEEQAEAIAKILTKGIPDYTPQEKREKAKQADEAFTGLDLWKHFDIKQLEIPDNL